MCLRIRTLPLLFICSMLFSSLSAQSLLNRQLSIQLDSVNIKQALDFITQKSTVDFSYSNHLISLDKRVSLHLKNAPLHKILNQLFSNTDIIYKKIGNQITLRKQARPKKLYLTKKGGKLHTRIKPLMLSQTIRGTVIDKDSKMPLIGASVWIQSQRRSYGTSTDIMGQFELKNVPIGRHQINAAYLGYEPISLPELKVISGKEMVLQIELTESPLALPEIEINAEVDLTASVNEMAVNSARTFSMDETKRYAASSYDPARMAMSFAGVSTTGTDNDLANELSIRGNSPRSNIWRLEGVDIPNPNHYGSLGSSGGSISMLSTNVLTHSDFYTGGFPAEFGNAIGGVFDLRMRNGNNKEREFSLMAGNLGIEASVEGPFVKGKKGAYLINYRYTSLRVLSEVGIRPIQNEDPPRFQDLSFKFNLPTRFGTFALFGVGGSSISSRTPLQDVSQWEEDFDRFGYREDQNLGIIGLSHRLLLTDNSYIQTVVAASRLKDQITTFFLEPNFNRTNDNFAKLKNRRYNFTTSYTNKINAHHTLRAGLTLSHRNFEHQVEELNGYRDERSRWGFFQNKRNTNLLQSFIHWKFRINDHWTLNNGIQAVYFAWNQSRSITPRMAVEWSPNEQHKVTTSVGVYSELPHEAFYFVKGITTLGDSISPSTKLKMTKSAQFIGGYQWRLNDRFRFKAEAYYQHIYHVPVTNNFGQVYSSVNASDVWGLIGPFNWVNDGKARNYGIDLTLERFFSKNYYFLLTGSLFRSRFKLANDREYSTRYDSNFRINLLSGKEFKLGKDGNKTIGINGKLIFEGGKRITPIDLERSKQLGFAYRDPQDILSSKLPFYHRIDLGLSYQINMSRQTHTFTLNIQNLTNRENAFDQTYNANSQSIVTIFHRGFIPILNYRLDF
ncbi:MAG: TonB-dependent receptor [Bacteroidota bacterium]